MSTTLIGMGSNIEPEKYLRAAAKVIREKFHGAQFSSVYQSEAVGMAGDDFLNACCLLQHDESEPMLLPWLKALEDEYGRDRSEGSWKPRTLDLDILMVDGQLLDDDLYRYAHVFVPASELIDCRLPEGVQHAVVTKVELTL